MRAHPAGPRHADVVPPGNTAGPVPATTQDLDELHPLVWPRGCARSEDGAVRFAGADVRELAEEYGTPLFLFDEDDFRSRCRDYATAFGDPASVHYAAKAFLCTELARWVGEEGLSLDVCSGGELAIALRADFPAERITFHGNNKSTEELAAAVDAGVGSVVLDSFHEIARLEHLAAERGVRQRVLVRVTVGVEAHTHEFIATAHEDQKFGFSLASGQAAEAAHWAIKSESLELVGLHSHIGSQIFDVDGFELAAHRVVRLLADLRAEHGADAVASVTTVDLGGGLGIAYTAADDPLPPAELASRLREIVGKECADAGFEPPQIAVEPGRAIVGPGMITVYEVGTTKDVDLDGGAVRRYVSVDGGMSDNIRTSLYGAGYDSRLVSRSAEAGPALSRIVGKHCESGDVVVRDCWLPEDIAPGDLLAVAATGAYCYSMASNYNRLPKPPVVAVREGRARLLLRRETQDDLLRLEV
ncbi:MULTISPECIES: diaminopimelate decarboxylase [Saccharopolyspora]|uniref:Diaminopimelate decarboxylase n=1 Tax=Saccharopolyspora cebuensis TaxID=418759 RepID=A0ABV4CEC8_9PSEU